MESVDGKNCWKIARFLDMKAAVKAVRLVKPLSPLELQDMDVPIAGPRDVLVRVKAAGICHSDAHYRAGRSVGCPLPLTREPKATSEVHTIKAQSSLLMT